MTRTGDERIAKLPQWAQSLISQLSQHAEYLEARLAEGPEDSDTFVQGGYGVAPDRPLGDRPTIRFELGENAHVNARIEDGMLVLRTIYSQLVVRPGAANMIYVGQVER